MTSPEVTWPEAVLTMTDVSENHVTRTKSHRSDRVHMHNRLPHFFLTIVVVQNIPLRVTDMATGCDVTPKMFPWKGVCMRNRKLHNIRPSGGLLTGNDVTWPRRPSSGKYTSAHAWSKVPFWCSLGHSRPIYHVLALSLVICHFPRHKGNAFNNYTTKVCCFRICSICTPSSLSRARSLCGGTK